MSENSTKYEIKELLKDIIYDLAIYGNVLEETNDKLKSLTGLAFEGFGNER